MTASAPISTYLDHNWQGGHESLSQEYDYAIEDIDGEIPAGLHGTLFRNGPGLLDVNGTPLKHPFDGDGMISAIRFYQGQAHFRNRFVRTEGYLAEQAAAKFSIAGSLAPLSLGDYSPMPLMSISRILPIPMSSIGLENSWRSGKPINPIVSIHPP